jgi:3-oxoacyl-[acyl-carrier-protein] synthase III
MDIIEAALIILVSVIVNVTITYLVLQLILIKMNLKPYVRMAKQFASQMGLQSQKVQHQKANVELVKQAKAKVTKAAIDSLDMGGILSKILDKAGISPEEIFALIQDQDFMKGVKVIIDTFGGIVGKVTGKGGEKQAGQSELQFGV